MPLNSLTYCRSRFKLGWCWAGEGWNVTKGYYDSQTSTKDSQNLCNELKFLVQNALCLRQETACNFDCYYFTRKFIQWKIWRKRARAKRWFVQKALQYVIDWVLIGQSCQIKKPVKPLLTFCIRIRKMPLVWS